MVLLPAGWLTLIQSGVDGDQLIEYRVADPDNKKVVLSKFEFGHIDWSNVALDELELTYCNGFNPNLVEKVVLSQPVLPCVDTVSVNVCNEVIVIDGTPVNESFPLIGTESVIDILVLSIDSIVPWVFWLFILIQKK